MNRFETITRHFNPGRTSVLQSALVLLLSVFVSACLIIEIEVTESVEAGGEVTVRIVVQENTGDANAWRGVEIVMVPSDWTFVSAEYTATDVAGDVGAGSLEVAANWADSAVVGVGDPPAGFKYVGLISDMPYAHADTLIMEVTAKFTAGQTGGDFPIGVIVTKESYFPSLGDWFATGGSTTNGADSTFGHVVTVTGGTGGAVTLVSELSPVPDDSLAALKAAGTALTGDQMYALLGANTPGTEDVTIVAVVMTDPLNSGLASWRDDEGGPGRLHIYVRDTAAASMGNAGMGIQLVDSDWRVNGSDELVPGDVIEATGRAGRGFETSMQFEPETVVPIGHYTDFGFPASIIAADTITTSDLNMGLGDGTHQANWDNYNDLNGAYVCFDGASVFRRTVTGGREDWVVTSDGGETIVNIYDPSLRYRNDRVGSYQPPFNVRSSSEDPFVPPAIGASVRLCGTINHQGDDPFFFGTPVESYFSLQPWADSDLEIQESPPQVSSPSTPELLLSSSDPYEVVADITFDPAREAVGATLFYVQTDGLGKTSSPDTTGIAMTNTEGTTWTAELPALGVDRAFAIYWVTAVDNTGAIGAADAVSYRVFDSPVASIAEIQQAVLPGGRNDYPSPVRGQTVSNLTVTVQNQPSVSAPLELTSSISEEFVAVQDDSDLGPWSGIVLDMDGAGISRGDVLTITSATVEENFGHTRLTDVVLGEASAKTGDAFPYKEVESVDLADRLGAEMHEGMAVTFNNVTIIDNESFGEWSFTNGTDDDGVLGDGASKSFPDDNSVFQPGERYEFIRGIWTYLFSTYKVVPEDMTDVGAQVGVAVEPIGEGIPGSFALKQNYPNPFNPTTMISFDIPATSVVTLEVYDLTGKKVATLMDEQHSAGSYQVSFDARDLSSGMYLYRLTAGEHVQTNKMLLMR